MLNSNEEEGTANDISLSLALINLKAKTSMSVFQNLACLSLVVWSNTT